MMRSRFRSLFRVVAFLVQAAATLALVGVIVCFALPWLVGWQVVVVLSGSMQPSLPLGSVVFVQPRGAASVEVGDILTYRLGSQGGPGSGQRVVEVTHRVVEVLHQGPDLYFRTQGDANKAPDPHLVPAENVVGTVWARIPYLGYVANGLRRPLVLLLLVGVPGALIVAGEVRSIVKEVRAIRARRRTDGEANP